MTAFTSNRSVNICLLVDVMKSNTILHYLTCCLPALLKEKSTGLHSSIFFFYYFRFLDPHTTYSFTSKVLETSSTVLLLI